MISVQQLLNMVTDGAILFVVATGLAVIFGLMQVINFAHGAFITVGAYTAVVVTDASISPWLAIPIGFIVGIVFGLIVEFLIIRRVYKNSWDTILATIGLGLVIVAGISIIFGRDSQFVNPPLDGSANLGFAEYSSYRVFLFFVAIAIFFVLWYLTTYTRVGLIARAVIANQELASSLGINGRKVRAWTFALGSAFAVMAGVLVVPLGTVEPNGGERYLVAAFMVVLVAGSSIGALAAGSLIYGAAASWVTYVTDPILGSVTTIVLTAAILRFFPSGLQPISLKGKLGLRPAVAKSGVGS